VDSAPPAVDSLSAVQSNAIDELVDNREHGELNVDGSLPCPDNACGTSHKCSKFQCFF
jgi:hypothetical protein